MPTQRFRQRFQPSFAEVTHMLYLLLVLYVWIRLAQYVIYSFSWPMDGDLSFLYYIAWLMNEHDYVPYRDVHETSFFGTFIFYASLTKLIGYTTTAFHWADLFFFSVLSLITYWLLKPFGRLCALLAIGLFGEFYFKMGFGVHLQRDFVAILPSALALVFLREKNISLTMRSFLVGMLFGVASCIKPQFAGGMLIAVWYLAFAEKESGDVLIKRLSNIFLFCTAGFVVVWAAGFLWLMAHGVANEFINMAFHYLPAYSSINGRNFARDSIDAWMGAGKWLWGMISIWGVAIVVSIYGAFHIDDTQNKQTRYWIIALALFWVLYLSYVPMAGKYWEYHILPSYYFLAIALSFIAASNSVRKNKIVTVIITCIWLLFYMLRVAENNVSIKHQELMESNEQASLTTKKLERFLKESLKKGDTTQAHVSHTRGPVFPALLAARALPASPYLENYLLYHDVDSPFVKKAREQFLSTLQKNPPRYIIYTSTLFGFRGPGTETMFIPFEKWMNEHYKRILASHQDFAPAFDRVEIYEYQGAR